MENQWRANLDEDCTLMKIARSTLVRGFLLFAAMLFSHCLYANTIDLGVLEERPNILLGEMLEFVEDARSEFNEDSVFSAKWSASLKTVPSFGFTPSTYWFRFTLDNSSAHAKDLMLELDYPLMDTIEFYLMIDGTVASRISTGDSLPFVNRPVSHRNFLFEITMEPRQTRTILLRAQSTDTMQLPLRLWNAKDFHQFDHNIQMLLGLYYGAMLMIIISNLYVYFLLRDKTYLYFIGSVVAFVTIQASLNGALPEMILRHSPVIAKHIRPFSIYACTFFFSGLAVNYLRLDLFAPNCMKAFAILSKSALMGILLQPFVPFTWSIKISMLMAATSGVIATLSAILAIAKHHRPAHWYLAAWLTFIFGSTATILRAFGILPVNLFTESASPIGSIIVALLLAFGLSERLNNDRKEKNEAQKDAFEKEHQLRLQQERENLLQIERLKLSEANLRLHQLSTTDSLTQLHNRHHFNEMFQTEFKRAYRDRTPLAILLMDIDHFKKVNDTYGHPFGDECLKFAATLIKSCIRRPQDFAGRYGGEEFVVLLPNTDTAGALHVATLLHDRFNDSTVRDGELEAKITVSIGLVSVVPGNEDSTVCLLKTADRLLYQAKKYGRNRVEFELQNSE